MDQKIRIGLCAAFHPGYEVASFVTAYPYPIEFIATCDRDNSEDEAKIAELGQAKKVPLLRQVNVNSAEFIATLKELAVDVVILAWWPSIVKQKAIESARVGWLNMHPSMLPYGRGKHGYYWSIVEGTPFGVTLHFIDKGIDTGPILFQREIQIAMTDTGETLYNKGVSEIIELFKESYPKLVANNFTACPQDDAMATYHHSSEIDPHSCIDLEAQYKAGDLINILRARTFMQGNSAFFFLNRKKYLIRVQIQEVNE